MTPPPSSSDIYRAVEQSLPVIRDHWRWRAAFWRTLAWVFIVATAILAVQVILLTLEVPCGE